MSIYSVEVLEHMRDCTSQYASVVNQLAKEVLEAEQTIRELRDGIRDVDGFLRQYQLLSMYGFEGDAFVQSARDHVTLLLAVPHPPSTAGQEQSR